MQFHFSIGSPAKTSALALLLCLTASGGDRSAAQQPSPQDDAVQMAAAIARTMSLTRPSPSANMPLVQQFLSHGRVVESRSITKDAKLFAELTAGRDNIQKQTTRYMCKADRRPYIKKGVVIDEVFIGPEPMKPFSFVIDEQACAAVIEPIIADPAHLRRLVDDTSKRLNAALSGKSTFPGSHVAALAVKGETIEVTNHIDALAFVDFFRFKDFEVRGKLQGFFCSQLGDAIRQGVKIRMIYDIEGQSPILDFPVDGSVC